MKSSPYCGTRENTKFAAYQRPFNSKHTLVDQLRSVLTNAARETGLYIQFVAHARK